MIFILENYETAKQRSYLFGLGFFKGYYIQTHLVFKIFKLKIQKTF